VHEGEDFDLKLDSPLFLDLAAPDTRCAVHVPPLICAVSKHGPFETTPVSKT
jgi:hypothetical protein